jgi:hypothetical protein
VQHRGDADPGAEMLRVGGDGRHRLGRGLKQQTVHRSLVLEGDVGDLGRQREDDVEVADRQRSASRSASQVRATAPWHLGQCRLRQLL